MNKIENLLKQRILILDGAMGTMIQGYKLEEQDYRGQQFKDHPADLKGNNDLLSLTQPQIIKEIHTAYLNAGADILETNTFNSTSVAQADYALEHIVYDLNYQSARIARESADDAINSPMRRIVYVRRTGHNLRSSGDIRSTQKRVVFLTRLQL